MKLVIVLALICCLQVSGKVFSQTEKLSLSIYSASIEDILSSIEGKTKCKFVYSNSSIPSTKINVNLTDAPVSEILALILKNTGLTWELLENNFIAIVPGNRRQQYLIRGKITDENNRPLPGVTISVKNTKLSATTDDEGVFSMTLPSRNETILVKYIGYKPYEEKVKAGSNLKIKLEPAVAQLQNVVVTGLFTRPAESFTGAAKSFTAEELAKVSNGNVLDALSALDPSFQMLENNRLGANPNTLPDVVLRGGNSLPDIGSTAGANTFNYANQLNSPLFILDGFEVSLQRINDLDMNRIARVTILKDAGATAIYGSRAANGVIVIETIRPKEGELQFTYSGNYVLESPDISGYNLLNASEKMKLEVLAGVYTDNFNSIQYELDLVRNSRQAEISRGVNTDWLSKPLQTGFGQKQNVYVEGGSGNILYGVNLTYNHRSGVMKGSGRRTISGNSYLSYRVKKFQFKNDLTLNFNKSTNSPYGSFEQYTRLNPYWSPTNDDGTQKLYLEEVRDPFTGLMVNNFNAYDNLNGFVGRAVNPLYNASLNTIDRTKYQDLVNNFSVQWQTLPWLRLTGRLSYQKQNDEYDLFLPAQHTSFTDKNTFEKGTYTKAYGQRNSLEGFISADASRSIDKHLFVGTIAANMKQDQYNVESFQVQGFPNAQMDQLILGNRFPDGSKPVGSESITRLIGVVGNLGYAYNNRYTTDFSYRLDGSSQFGSKNRMAPFWAVGAGWNIHNEAFIKGVNFVNRMRLRYTLGTTGSQNFPAYLGTTTLQYYTNSEYRGSIVPFLLGYGNQDLSWQKTVKNNAGIDLSLFNHLDITANYFIEKTKGSIGAISTALSTGFSQYFANMGDLKNNGLEISARYNIINSSKNRNNWSIFANVFKVRSKIEKVSNSIAALNAKANKTESTLPQVRFAEGQSPTAIWAVRSLGIDPATGEEVFLSKSGQLTSRYSPLDQVIVGDTRADLEGNFGTNFEVNGIGFNAYFRFSYGGQLYNQTLIDRVENVRLDLYNVDKRVLEERWKKPGDHTFFKAVTGRLTTTTKASSRFVQNNNYINCENISLYYRPSNALNKKMGLRNTKITLYSANVFRFSSIKLERGLDYPFSRSFTLQLQASF